jgi:hypothetical protein
VVIISEVIANVILFAIAFMVIWSLFRKVFKGKSPSVTYTPHDNIYNGTPESYTASKDKSFTDSRHEISVEERVDRTTNK